MGRPGPADRAITKAAEGEMDLYAMPSSWAMEHLIVLAFPYFGQAILKYHIWATAPIDVGSMHDNYDIEI